ncbi:TlpA family protein disulfide reductase [Myxococcota bacterium]|nr:TlpA family protein disulfide reductase [Myxococcota bacterium]MBU1899474.1 TlpA family protein disulfide reductase [Myxococcota bacterium]
MSGLICAALTLLSAAPPTMSPPRRATIGQTIPFFAGWTLDDRVLNREKILATPRARGHIIVLFTTWCAPCEVGIKTLNAQQEWLRERGIYLWLINIQESPEEVKKYKEKHKITAPIILDRFSRTAETLGDFKEGKGKLPKTITIDDKGEIRGIIQEEGDDYIERIKVCFKISDDALK